MQKILYFICPTDHLEQVINSASQEENYFITSLGNSIAFERQTIEEISELLCQKNIRKISFVLSAENQVVLDLISKEGHSKINEFSKLCSQIGVQKDLAQIIQRTGNLEFFELSYYLNEKMNLLRSKLKNSSSHSIFVNGKIYNRENKTFSSVYSELICSNYVSAN